MGVEILKGIVDMREYDKYRCKCGNVKLNYGNFPDHLMICQFCCNLMEKQGVEMAQYNQIEIGRQRLSFLMKLMDMQIKRLKKIIKRYNHKKNKKWVINYYFDVLADLQNERRLLSIFTDKLMRCVNFNYGWRDVIGFTKEKKRRDGDKLFYYKLYIFGNPSELDCIDTLESLAISKGTPIIGQGVTNYKSDYRTCSTPHFVIDFDSEDDGDD